VRALSCIGDGVADEAAEWERVRASSSPTSRRRDLDEWSNWRIPRLRSQRAYIMLGPRAWRTIRGGVVDRDCRVHGSQNFTCRRVGVFATAGLQIQRSPSSLWRFGWPTISPAWSPHSVTGGSLIESIVSLCPESLGRKISKRPSKPMSPLRKRLGGGRPPGPSRACCAKFG